MIKDALLEFSNDQALGAVTNGSSVVSTNVRDMGTGRKDCWDNAENPDISELVLNTQVTAALVGAGAKVKVALVTKATAPVTGGTEICSVMVPALSAAGTKLAIKLPVGQKSLRYIGVIYTADGANLTSASFSTGLSLDN